MLSGWLGRRRETTGCGKWIVFGVFLVVIMVGTAGVVPAQAAEPSASELLGELRELRKEVQELRAKVSEFEAKEGKMIEKVAEVEKKAQATGEAADKVTKKVGRDRINWGGELRLRIVSERATTTKGFFGAGQPTRERKYKNETGFPTRLRLNFNTEVIPDIVDFYGRLTVNKRWGNYSTWPDQDPLDSVNSFHSGIGSDVSTRVEHAYAKFNIRALSSEFSAGRLAAMDGPPSRQNAPFPRVFIDEELDGAMWEFKLPETFLDKGYSAIAIPTEGTEKYPLGKGSLASYGKKLKEGNSFILAYAKYREMGFTNPRGSSTGEGLLGLEGRGPDTDVYVAQGRLKLSKDTALVVSAAYMPDWYMPRYSFDTAGSFKWSETYTSSNRLSRITIPYFNTQYSLVGAYLDTQIWKFQVYGAGYYNEFSIPRHRWRTQQRANEGVNWSASTPMEYPGDDFNGHAWWFGFNTGDAIAPNQQLCVEYFEGSKNWINPLNYRGFRRKGTVLNAANNYYYNNGLMSDTLVVGFYPVNARIWDIYYDYFLRTNCRFRVGYMDFRYDLLDEVSPIGTSGYERHKWPYFEINLSF